MLFCSAIITCPALVLGFWAPSAQEKGSFLTTFMLVLTSEFTGRGFHYRFIALVAWEKDIISCVLAESICNLHAF
jgi:hypothetical protein